MNKKNKNNSNNNQVNKVESSVNGNDSLFPNKKTIDFDSIDDYELKKRGR